MVVFPEGREESLSLGGGFLGRRGERPTPVEAGVFWRGGRKTPVGVMVFCRGGSNN